MKNNERNDSTSKVKPIETEYTQSLHQKVNQKQAQKVRLYRRLVVFALTALIICTVLTVTFINQKKVLAAKIEEKEQLLLDLEEVENEQVILNEQLIKLDDDEYIAKLAREQYFLSESYEIIFSMPKDSDKKEEQEGEKE